MTISLLSVQTAIFQTLFSDSTIIGLTTGVFDEVPENQPFPYIAIETAQEEPADVFDRMGRKPDITIAIFSQAKGYTEGLTIANRVNKLLNRNSLPMIGYDTAYCMYKMTTTGRQGDGLTRKITMHYELLVEAQ